MATEQNAGISDHISSFAQGGIVQRSRLDKDKKSASSVTIGIAIVGLFNVAWK